MIPGSTLQLYGLGGPGVVVGDGVSMTETERRWRGYVAILVVVFSSATTALLSRTGVREEQPMLIAVVAVCRRRFFCR